MAGVLIVSICARGRQIRKQVGLHDTANGPGWHGELVFGVRRQFPAVEMLRVVSGLAAEMQDVGSGSVAKVWNLGSALYRHTWYRYASLAIQRVERR